MPNRAHFALPLVAAFVSLAAQARADVAPPATYVEECTLAKKQTADNDCLECKDSHHPDYKERCTKMLAPYCYSHVCNAWGGTAFLTIWCRSKDPGMPVVPESIKSQLSGYEQPTLEGTAGAANCPTPAPVANAGASSTATTTPATPASGGARSTTDDNAVSGTGCSVTRISGTAGGATLALLGLLGLTLRLKRSGRR